MSSSKKKTSHQFNKKMIRNQIYSSPIRFDHVSQEIFCDACGISVSWSNIIEHCKNSVRHDKNVEVFKSKIKRSIQTLCTTNEMEAELPNVAG